MDINIIGVPLYYGCDREGVELGPDKLREKNILKTIQNHGHRVYDVGDIYVPKVCLEDRYKDHDKLKYLQSIVEVNSNLAHQVFSSLSSGRFPLILGGDHALGLGSISGASRYFDNLGVVWIDAHGDINTPETSPSGNIHGMPLAAAMGEGHTSLKDIYFKGMKVKAENVFIIGARDLDPGEIALIEEKNVNLYSMNQIKRQGLNRVLKSMIKKIENRNLDAIHLSFDLDSMDGDLVPGTGLPIPDGLTMNQTKSIFETVIDTHLVRSMDLVELNPLLDQKDRTADLTIELAGYISKVMADTDKYKEKPISL